MEKKAHPLLVLIPLTAILLYMFSISSANVAPHTPNGKALLEDITPSTIAVQDVGNGTKILFLKDRAMNVYSFQEKNVLAYIHAVNTLKSKMPENVTLSVMLIPDQIALYEQEAIVKQTNSQINGLKYISKKLDSNILMINPIENLLAHKDEALYFRTDHHWTARGAYYTYETFAALHDFKILPLNKYKTGSVPNFVGTRSKLKETLSKYPDKLEYFLHPDTKSFSFKYIKDNKWYNTSLVQTKAPQNYRIFLDGDHPLAIVSSGAKNGKRLLVIKDSFANAFIPYLAPHYEKIIIVDPRHRAVKVNTLIEEYNITEVLLANVIHTANKPYYKTIESFY